MANTGTSHPGRITINTGTFSEDTCVTENDLIKNQVKRPAIRQMMEYANRRSLTTLLVSGVVTPYGINNTEKTKIGDVMAKGKSVGNNGYQFPVMGRIEKASAIIRQIGSTTVDGRFQLLMQDRHLYDGMNAIFHGNRFQARVEGNPQGSPSAGYIYNFWAPSGDIFNWTTHVAGQSGTKTCMGAYTSYGENSKRSDSRSKYSDMFINHTTIQRKTCAITGTAASQVLWYTFTDAEGGQSRGWMYQQLQQGQAQFLMEDERQKWFGVSTMKNPDGSLRMAAPVNNEGYPIIAGDGWEEQVAGGNVMEGSGTNGEATIGDFTEMMKQLEKKSDKINSVSWVMPTGTDGFANFQTQCVALGLVQNITFFNQIEKDGRPGGPLVDVGYNFASFNVNGNQLICVKHPLFDDELMFTERGNDGNILMSSTYFLMNMGSGENKNMEILYKSANGVNRENVTARLNGLTGDTEMSVSEEDAMKYAMLKEDLMVIYNTQECGIIRKAF